MAMILHAPCLFSEMQIQTALFHRLQTQMQSTTSLAVVCVLSASQVAQMGRHHVMTANQESTVYSVQSGAPHVRRVCIYPTLETSDVWAGAAHAHLDNFLTQCREPLHAEGAYPVNTLQRPAQQNVILLLQGILCRANHATPVSTNLKQAK